MWYFWLQQLRWQNLSQSGQKVFTFFQFHDRLLSIVFDWFSRKSQHNVFRHCQQILGRWFPLTTFWSSINLMCLQVLLRISISFVNHNVNNFICDTTVTAIEGKNCIISGSRSYCLDEFINFHEFYIRFWFYCTLDLRIYSIISNFFVRSSRLHAHPDEIIIQRLTSLSELAFSSVSDSSNDMWTISEFQLLLYITR